MGWDFHKTNLARDATIPNNWESGKNSSLLLLITGIAISANSIKGEVTEATALTNKRDGFPTWRLPRGPTWRSPRFSSVFSGGLLGFSAEIARGTPPRHLAKKQAAGSLRDQPHFTRKGLSVRTSFATYAGVRRVAKIRGILKRIFSRE